MTQPLTLDELCIHQVCVWKQSSFASSLDSFARHGVTKTALWRPMVEDVGVKRARQILGDSGVAAISMCPLVLLDPDQPLDRASRERRQDAFLADAAELGVESVVVITGGLPPGSKDLAGRRSAVLEELARLIPVAAESGVKLALEPLHPMVCGFRSVISTLAEANDILDALDRDDVIGIAVDSYALWWDPNLQDEIARAGTRLFNFHVSDWLLETHDVRVDRGMSGDGLIDNALIRSWMAKAGYAGSVEVEILSEHWWLKQTDTVVSTICDRLDRM